MSSETLIEISAAANGVSSRPLAMPSPGYSHSPSPPSTNSLASHLLAAVSQVQSLSSQLPPSVHLPNCSPPGGVYIPGGLLGTALPQLHLGSEPPMSSLLAGLKDFPRPYHSPPPLPSSESHECKIVEYRGAKVAAFIIGGETMLCLPQAFELFLKHLVGGLHTVYTKLKRLGIEPLVCNVDQVRILRGLGAIQPGVNRCKLLSVQHFDILYRDCTTARPGRPPKRASDFMTMTSSPESLFDLKKRHLENGIGGGAVFPNGHIGNDPRLDKSPLLANGYHAPPHFNPLQYMAHHMAGLGYPHLLPAGLPGGVPGGHGSHPHQISPPDTSPMKQITPETLARMHEERVERERQMMLDVRRGLPPSSLSALGSLHSSHIQTHNHHHLTSMPPISTSSVQDDHQPPSSPILNLSKTISSEGGAPPEDREEEEEERESELRSQGSSSHREEESSNRRIHSKPSNNSSTPTIVVSTSGGTVGDGGVGGPRPVDRLSDMEEEAEKDESMDTGDIWSLNSSTPGMTQLTPPPQNVGVTPLGFGGSAPLSSTEVLLRNILGLLRVAEENARHHERQTQYEKAELKMEVLRERELRETLEKQLQEEQRNRILMQKRCAKLKKLRRRLQERLDLEVKRRSRYEDHLRSASPDVLNDINDMEAIAKELQQESLHQQKQQQLEEERNKETVDRLLASPSLANHPAIAAATAVVTSNWR